MLEVLISDLLYACVCIYIYQSQSPNSSHPHFISWYPYICSLSAYTYFFKLIGHFILNFKIYLKFPKEESWKVFKKHILILKNGT